MSNTNALFTNFSEESFTGYWNGKPKTFKPGQSLYMPDYLARHFAKHLVNRELLRVKPDGTYVHKDGDKMTSPKRPEDVPMFMDLFNKAYTPDEEEETMSMEEDSVDAAIDLANKHRGDKQSPDEPQIIVPPDFDEDGDEDESAFQGKPNEGESTPPSMAVGL